MKKLLVSWSSGKDSAWALHVLRQQGEYDIVGLVTTLNSAFDRVAMHSTRRELVEAQAEAAGLPLWTVPLPWPCSNADYEAAMRGVVDRALAAGVEAMAFGDLFLTDVRTYREDRLAGSGIEPIFPVWGLETHALARTMLAAGVKARIVCVDPKQLPSSFAGRDLDEALLAELPPTADPCGENGEFHTFVYDGPMFAHPIPIQSGETVTRDNFTFSDCCAQGESLRVAPPVGRR
jgi:uncharacterized protein (TIGR00290 family)